VICPPWLLNVQSDPPRVCDQGITPRVGNFLSGKHKPRASAGMAGRLHVHGFPLPQYSYRFYPCGWRSFVSPSVLLIHHVGADVYSFSLQSFPDQQNIPSPTIIFLRRLCLRLPFQPSLACHELSHCTKLAQDGAVYSQLLGSTCDHLRFLPATVGGTRCQQDPCGLQRTSTPKAPTKGLCFPQKALDITRSANIKV
jgi:hypothetical protein